MVGLWMLGSRLQLLPSLLLLARMSSSAAEEFAVAYVTAPSEEVAKTLARYPSIQSMFASPEGWTQGPGEGEAGRLREHPAQDHLRVPTSLPKRDDERLVGGGEECRYEWEGKIEEEGEAMLIIKSRQSAIPKVTSPSSSICPL